MPVMNIIRSLKEGIVIDSVNCRGLLVIKKTKMANLCVAGMNVSYSKIRCCESTEDDLPLGLLCAGIKKLTE